MHAQGSFATPRAAVREIGREAHRTGAQRVLIDTGGVIGQLAHSEHAELGRHIAAVFGSTRVAAIAPVGRPVGEIAPSARHLGCDYMGFATRGQALDWLLRE